jgi:hypothetical protein
MNQIIIILFIVILHPYILGAVIIKVGQNEVYKKPSEAASKVNDGDTVDIESGVYEGDVCIWRKNNLLIRGTGGIAHLKAAGKYIEGKGIWVIKGNNTTVENIEFSEASVPDQNGAGIRQEGINLTVRHCYFHDCEDGILSGANTNSNILIEFTEFSHCGYGNGYSHNLYIGNINSLTFRFCYSHHANVGHNLKSRANNNFILYNRIMDEDEGNSSMLIDLPNGGLSYIIGNVLMKGTNAENRRSITFGSEGLSNPGKNLYVINNTMENRRSTGTFIFDSSHTARIVNNLFIGTGDVILTPADSMSNLLIISSINAGIKDASNFDYSLTSASPAIDGGTDPGISGTFSLMPLYEYRHNSDSSTRWIENKIDIGAYEFHSPNHIKEDCRKYFMIDIEPNPVRNCANIYIRTKNPGFLEISFSDTKGNIINTIFSKYVSEGEMNIPLCPAQIQNNLSSGVYFLKSKMNNINNLRTIIFIK